MVTCPCMTGTDGDAQPIGVTLDKNLTNVASFEDKCTKVVFHNGSAIMDTSTMGMSCFVIPRTVFQYGSYFQEVHVGAVLEDLMDDVEETQQSLPSETGLVTGGIMFLLIGSCCCCLGCWFQTKEREPYVVSSTEQIVRVRPQSGYATGQYMPAQYPVAQGFAQNQHMGTSGPPAVVMGTAVVQPVTLEVTVPQGSEPGSVVAVQTPDNRTELVTVPQGMQPGSTFQVTV